VAIFGNYFGFVFFVLKQNLKKKEFVIEYYFFNQKIRKFTIKKQLGDINVFFK
jgi:hypothetical protein